MPVIRNQLALSNAGGPRQFSEVRDRIMVRVDTMNVMEDVLAQADNYELQGEPLDNAPVITLTPRDTLESSLDSILNNVGDGQIVRKGISEIQNARDSGNNIIELGQEAVNATQNLLDAVDELDGVSFADFVVTKADYGPENLRLMPGDMPTVAPSEAGEKTPNLSDMNEKLGLPDAWEVTRGDQAIACIFDTGYAKGLISEDRIVGTYHGEDVNSVYASEEGHGTMCAGAMTANADEGVPFNGTAPEADVILVRITDSEGQIRSDIISNGYDWLMDRAAELDKPIVANHSYGTPLCSGRPKQRFCSGPEQDVIRIANSSSDITSVYAAGNEAMRCGHRPSGLTNAITGSNSLQDVITVGALLFNGNDAQRYSSHGRGDCSPVSDPKPNVSCILPSYTYYGVEDGWKIKDMSTGVFGSSGGTSHGSPSTAGMVTLMQSAANDPTIELSGEDIATRGGRGSALETEELKRILINYSEPPRRTQVNSFGLLLSSKGYDARFGHGQFRVDKAMKDMT